MRQLFFLLYLITAFGCQPSKEEHCAKLDAAIRQYYEDAAFKNNKPIKIYDIKTVDYSMVGEGKLDTLNQLRYLNMEEAYINQYQAAKAVIEAKVKYVEALKEINGQVSEFDKDDLIAL